MIQYVYEQAKKVRGVSEILVATDHPAIAETVEEFGGKAVITPQDLASGTDRVAFVAKNHPAEIFVNLQGDEPMMDSVAIERAVELVKNGKFSMASAAAPILNDETLNNPNVVKVLINERNQAIYFSRLPIPYSRLAPEKPYLPLHHLGLYVYTKKTLLKLTSLDPCPLEKAESLEQLRALYHEIPIGIALVEKASQGIDTAQDLEKVTQLIK